MKIKDIKTLYERESEKSEIKMSDRLKNTPIKTSSDDFFDDDTVNNGDTLIASKKKINMRILTPVLVSFILVIGIILSVLNVFSFGSNLTAYILEINPSICITANAEEEIVGVYSLNEDADTVLSDETLSDIVGKKLDSGIQNIIKIVIDKGFFDSYDKPFGIYVINDNNQIKKEKLKTFGEMVAKNLSDNGKGNITFEEREMSFDDFKGRMNIDGDFKRLDDMENEMKNKDRYFKDPQHQGLDPAPQNSEPPKEPLQ